MNGVNDGHFFYKDNQHKFGERDFNTCYHAMLAEAIHQANQVESILDDFFAAEHLKQQDKEPSLQSYFNYIENELQGKTLSYKCSKLLKTPNVLQILTDNDVNIDDTEQLLSEWRSLRNKLTHGLIVWNTSSIPILYHKGYCYEIKSHVNKFFQLNGQVVAIISMLEELESPYNGIPLLHENCDPDHPIIAEVHSC